MFHVMQGVHGGTGSRPSSGVCPVASVCTLASLNDTPTSGPLHGVWGPSPHAPGQPGQAELPPDPRCLSFFAVFH